ncbi:hypothetical protein [Photobacterium kasasachensis]|uniref:hypothetical protein n=1 Tax=Photobacterium kasasachensis TaxID=2910240 RepID=UPI003D0D0F40
MSYWVNHLMGNSDIEYPLEFLSSLYSELSDTNDEHADVSLTHDTEWCISAFASGLVIWENVSGQGEPKHMKNISKEKLLSLWHELAVGNISKIEQEPWLLGYGESGI